MPTSPALGYRSHKQSVNVYMPNKNAMMVGRGPTPCSWLAKHDGWMDVVILSHLIPLRN